MRALFASAVVGVAACSTPPPPLAPTGGVAQTTARVVVEPVALAFVSSSHDDPAPPAVAVLGAGEGPRTRILLRFDPPAGMKAAPLKAYLVLERAKGALAGPLPVTLSTERVTEPWSVADGLRTSWNTPPASEPLLSATVATRGSAPIRIDVTEWAQALAKPTKGKVKSWGLRIEAKGEGYGLPIATGYGGGTAPILELYLPAPLIITAPASST